MNVLTVADAVDLVAAALAAYVVVRTATRQRERARVFAHVEVSPSTAP